MSERTRINEPSVTCNVYLVGLLRGDKCKYASVQHTVDVHVYHISWQDYRGKRRTFQPAAAAFLYGVCRRIMTQSTWYRSPWNVAIEEEWPAAIQEKIEIE